MRVRDAVAQDAEAIARIRVLGWQTAYRGMIPDAFLDAMTPDSDARRRWIQNPDPGIRTLVAADDDAGVVGFVVAGPARFGSEAGSGGFEVYAVYVHPDRKRRGVGRALMAAALEGVDGPAVLWALAANSPALSFYAVLGFAPDGTRRTEMLGGAAVEEIRLSVRPRPGTAV